MKKWLVGAGLLVITLLAIFGTNPFANTVDPEATLVEASKQYKTETKRMPDGTYLVAVRTPMPGVKAKMVKWWFTDYMQTSDHYKRWHPKDHVWMDWENKVPGQIVGASHLVHEYIGGEMNKLRIQFIPAEQMFGYDPNEETLFVLCARPGLLETPIYGGKMCHVVRDNEDGAEMRSRFWLGHVGKRKGDEEVASIEGVLGNVAIVRLIGIRPEGAEGLKTHAIEEMSTLASFLPALYAAHHPE
ncbi:MAG: hypothetical protein ABJ013_07780 [Halioglobus sp.]